MKELAASMPKADQQAAKQLSHQFDNDVEAAVSCAKTAHALNLSKRAQIAAGRCAPSLSETSSKEITS